MRELEKMGGEEDSKKDGKEIGSGMEWEGLESQQVPSPVRRITGAPRAVGRAQVQRDGKEHLVFFWQELHLRAGN